MRFYDENDMFYGDAIILAKETNIDEMYHPYQPLKSCSFENHRNELLLKKVMKDGEIQAPDKTTTEIADYVGKRLSKLPDEHKRFENPHIYKVGISRNLMELRNKLIENIKSKY